LVHLPEAGKSYFLGLACISCHLLRDWKGNPTTFSWLKSGIFNTGVIQVSFKMAKSWDAKITKQLVQQLHR
jgi:hypothetical protein